MSGIAVVFSRTAALADGALLDRMLAVADYRGLDGVTRLCEGPAALGHLRLITTPELVHEQQPARGDASRVAVVFDGRLDDRTGLRDSLIARGAHLRDDTDAELVLRAYEIFGDDLPRHLVGDFALAVWNARDRAVFLARDTFGARPLHYYVDCDVLVAGSDLVQVLQAPIQRAPNEELVAELLAGHGASAEETLYRDVWRLPPAHTLRVDARSVHRARYWAPEDVPRVRYGNDAAYAEHFAAVFESAVKTSLRAHGPVGLNLSGGLDSSSVVATARALQASGAVSPVLETLSYVYPGEPHDERRWSRQVVERWPGTHHELVGAPRPVAESVEQARRFLDLPNPPNSTTHEQLAFTRARGMRVRLGGGGGDELLDPLSEASVDVELLREGRLSTLLERPGPAVRRALLRASLATVGAEALLGRLRGVLRPVRPPPWLAPAFASSLDLRARIERARSPIPGFARSERHRPFYLGEGVRSIEQEERIAALHGCEPRRPFAYRPLVELTLGLPVDQLLGAAANKFVLRNAMRDRLPDAVRTRSDKAFFSGLYRRELAGHASDALLRLTSRFDWLDRPSVIEGYRRLATSSFGGSPLYHPLWMLYAVEKWFSASFDE